MYLFCQQSCLVACRVHHRHGGRVYQALIVGRLRCRHRSDIGSGSSRTNVKLVGDCPLGHGSDDMAASCAVYLVRCAIWARGQA